MMRPSTAKAMQQKREANRQHAREQKEAENDDLMIISSMDLNKHQSKGDIPLPRYRSMKMNVHDEAKENESGNRTRTKGNSSGYGAD